MRKRKASVVGKGVATARRNVRPVRDAAHRVDLLVALVDIGAIHAAIEACRGLRQLA